MSSLSTKAGGKNPRSFYSGGTKSGPFHKKRTHLINGTVDYIQPFVQEISHEVEHFLGYELSDFHRRKNAGELLPYTTYKKMSENLDASGSLSVTGTAYRNDWVANGHSHGYLNFRPLPTYTGGNLVNNILTVQGIDPLHEVQRAAAALYSRGWDELTFLAELAQTVRMFRGALGKFLELVRALADSPRDARNWQKAIDAWLEGRYGWRILLKDIEDINNLLRTINEAQRTRTKERVGNSYSHISTETLVDTRSFGTIRADATTTWDVSVRGSIIADFMPSQRRINLLATAYELSYLSFVVDWFYDIGRAIEAYSFVILNHQYTAAWGLHVEYSYTIDNVELTPGIYWTGSCEQESSFTHESFERKPTTVPYAPQLNVNLNVFKVADLLALLGQAWLRLTIPSWKT